MRGKWQSTLTHCVRTPIRPRSLNRMSWPTLSNAALSRRSSSTRTTCLRKSRDRKTSSWMHTIAVLTLHFILNHLDRLHNSYVIVIVETHQQNCVVTWISQCDWRTLSVSQSRSGVAVACGVFPLLNLSLNAFSINRLHLLLPFYVFLHSRPTLSRSLYYRCYMISNC